MEISSDPLTDISEGVTRGIIKETKESVKDTIKSFIEKFKNRKIGFIQDPETIKVVVEQRKVGELKQYKDFIEDKKMIEIIIMGLTLRKLEKDKKYDRMEALRNKIYMKYNLEGLHIAQVIQNGILSRYIVNLLEQGFSMDDTKKQVIGFLNAIEKHVCFVSSDKVVDQVVDEIKSKINSHSPNIFILSGTGSAKSVTVGTYKSVLNENLPYIIEKYSNPIRELYFFNRLINPI